MSKSHFSILAFAAAAAIVLGVPAGSAGAGPVKAPRRAHTEAGERQRPALR